MKQLFVFLLSIIVLGCSKEKQVGFPMEGTFSFRGGIIWNYPGTPPYGSNFSFDSVLMRTSGSDAVVMDWVYGGTIYGRGGMTPSGTLFFFNDLRPNFHFNVVTDTCTSVNNWAAGATKFLQRDPNFFSRFDSTTGIYYLAYKSTQSGGPDIYFYDTLKYIGPVP